MMGRATLWLVVIVSCAHAMVHVYELSLPSVEQLISAEYFPVDPAQGEKNSGWLAFAWRLPWGLCALGAGWLVDRVGTRRMLAVYLFGCAAACGLAGFVQPLPSLFLVMIGMGAFAAIYHPAGLALISHETTAATRPRALGIHGIFGSAGIGGAPFLAGLVLSFTAPNWRPYFLILMVPGILLGIVFVILYLRQGDELPTHGTGANGQSKATQLADWGSFSTLVPLAMLMGFVYSAVLSFLPRYLGEAGIRLPGVPDEGTRNYLAGGVLLIGCVGQYLSGRFARPKLLELQLAAIILGTVPCLVWMGLATGWERALATSLFALIHFMHQPIYNSLIAKYTPRHRRSLCYGLSFMMAFGLGSFGAPYSRYASPLVANVTLAALATASGLLAIVLWSRNRRARSETD